MLPDRFRRVALVRWSTGLRALLLTGAAAALATVTAFVVGPAIGGLLLGFGEGSWTVLAGVVLSVVAVALLVGLVTAARWAHCWPPRW